MSTPSPVGPADAKGLIETARGFREREKVYLDYADCAREALTAQIESRLKALREEGVVSDAHDALLNQLRGIRTRFAEVDAIVRSLLIQAPEEASPAVLEELLAALTALQALELEARSAQTRIALAAAFRDYVGGHDVRTRSLTFPVEAGVARAFHALTGAVREQQGRLFGRHDAFNPQDLLTRLVALGTSNVPLLAHMGAPALVPQEFPR